MYARAVHISITVGRRKIAQFTIVPNKGTTEVSAHIYGSPAGKAIVEDCLILAWNSITGSQATRRFLNEILYRRGYGHPVDLEAPKGSEDPKGDDQETDIPF